MMSSRHIGSVQLLSGGSSPSPFDAAQQYAAGATYRSSAAGITRSGSARLPDFLSAAERSTALRNDDGGYRHGSIAASLGRAGSAVTYLSSSPAPGAAGAYLGATSAQYGTSTSAYTAYHESGYGSGAAARSTSVPRPSSHRSAAAYTTTTAAPAAAPVSGASGLINRAHSGTLGSGRTTGLNGGNTAAGSILDAMRTTHGGPGLARNSPSSARVAAAAAARTGTNRFSGLSSGYNYTDLAATGSDTALRIQRRMGGDAAGLSSTAPSSAFTAAGGYLGSGGSFTGVDRVALAARGLLPSTGESFRIPTAAIPRVTINTMARTAAPASHTAAAASSLGPSSVSAGAGAGSLHSYSAARTTQPAVAAAEVAAPSPYYPPASTNTAFAATSAAVDGFYAASRGYDSATLGHVPAAGSSSAVVDPRLGSTAPASVFASERPPVQPSYLDSSTSGATAAANGNHNNSGAGAAAQGPPSLARAASAQVYDHSYSARQPHPPSPSSASAAAAAATASPFSVAAQSGGASLESRLSTAGSNKGGPGSNTGSLHADRDGHSHQVSQPQAHHHAPLSSASNISSHSLTSHHMSGPGQPPSSATTPTSPPSLLTHTSSLHVPTRSSAGSSHPSSMPSVGLALPSYPSTATSCLATGSHTSSEGPPSGDSCSDDAEEQHLGRRGFGAAGDRDRGCGVVGQLASFPTLSTCGIRDLGPGSGCVGLQNLGNTCFMNSILQLLNAVPELVAWCHGEGPRGGWKSKANVGPAYTDLVASMWKAGTSVVSPSAFLRRLSRHDGRWGEGSQQDANEFLHSLLESLQSDSNRIAAKPAYRQLEGKGSEEAQAAEAEAYARSWNDSMVDDIFGGTLQSTQQCQACGRQSHCFDPIMGLAVPIPPVPKSRTVTVQDCLQAFVEVEQLDGSESYKCEACKKCGPHTKRLQVWRPPRVLVVTLKRFAQRAAGSSIFSRFRSASKNAAAVGLEADGLDLGPYCNPLGLRMTGSKAPVYELAAISHHSGSLEGGHYTASARSAVDGRWYHFNDGSVRQEQRPSGASASAYVLLYRLVGR